MQTLNTALSRKVTVSYQEQAVAGFAFGDQPTRTIAPLDDLAAADTGQHNSELAYLTALISAWAYSDEKVLAAKLKYYGLRSARIRRVTVQNNALLVVTTGYLIQSESGKTAVLAFRGTDPGDFITVLGDAQVMPRRFGGGNVHSGFFTSVEVVWDDIHEALDAARRGCFLDSEGKEQPMPNRLQALYVTGHSLGGAMALLATARLFGRGYEGWQPHALIKGVYTFGQPMVGDRAFAKACSDRFGSKLFRHVFNDDLIPHVPPKSGFDYAHEGGEWRASHIGASWAPSPASGRASLAAAGVFALLNLVEARVTPRDRIDGYSIDDHMPSNYMEAARLAFDPESAPLATPQASLPRITSQVLEGVHSARRRLNSAMTNLLGGLERVAS